LINFWLLESVEVFLPKNYWRNKDDIHKIKLTASAGVGGGSKRILGLLIWPEQAKNGNSKVRK
jgi:hypothetical protein